MRIYNPENLPPRIDDEATLDELMTRPSPGLVDSVSRLDGDIVMLGVGGKMGPTMARMLRRALDEAGASNRVVAVSRFSSPQVREQLESWGVETHSADLLDPKQLADVPQAPNVLYLVGMKFGATGQEALTWAMNTYLPGMVAQHFPGARISALSTGNVYPLVPVTDGGSREADSTAPVGEYAQSCLGRERIFSYWTEQMGSPLCIVRLNYAADLRYGVLLDVGQQVYAKQPVDISMGYLNCVWQGYANEVVIRALDVADSPPRVLNLTGPETISVRRLAAKFGERFGLMPELRGEEAPTALLSDASVCHALFGYPLIGLDRLIDWTAHWIEIGGPTLNKPTHFQTRDGKF